MTRPETWTHLLLGAAVLGLLGTVAMLVVGAWPERAEARAGEAPSAPQARGASRGNSEDSDGGGPRGEAATRGEGGGARGEAAARMAPGLLLLAAGGATGYVALCVETTTTTALVLAIVVGLVAAWAGRRALD